MRANPAYWLALAAVALVIEWRLPAHGLVALLRRVASSRVGRVLLVAGWGFLAVHLFARYGSRIG